MDRSRAEFNVLEKITQERLARGWSEYTLAKNSGIAQSLSLLGTEKIYNHLSLPLKKSVKV